ncbi:MAG: ribonuclease Z [Clostridium sp.]
MLDICLLGTGGMMPLPYRWLTALMTRCDGSNILIDCGEGTQIALKEKGWSPKPIDIICFTHYHADHISGLPGLLLTMGNAERTEPVTMIGPRGLERVVSALRMIAPELPFELNFIELTENQEKFRIGPYVIDAYRVNHNVVCYGYAVSIPRKGRFDVNRAKKENIPQKLWNRLQRGETVEDGGRILTPDMVMGAERRGIKVVYCTDTRPVPIISEYAKDADLFICEGMYGEDGKEAKAREYKHMTFYEAAKLAKTAEPKEMWLTHYSPSLTRPEEFLDKAREIFPRTKTARDGWTAEIGFDED